MQTRAQSAAVAPILAECLAEQREQVTMPTKVCWWSADGGGSAVCPRATTTAPTNASAHARPKAAPAQSVMTSIQKWFFLITNLQTATRAPVQSQSKCQTRGARKLFTR